MLFVIILFVILITNIGFYIEFIDLKHSVMYNTFSGNTSEAIAKFPRDVYYSFRAIIKPPDKVDNVQKVEG